MPLRLALMATGLLLAASVAASVHLRCVQRIFHVKSTSPDKPLARPGCSGCAVAEIQVDGRLTVLLVSRDPLHSLGSGAP